MNRRWPRGIVDTHVHTAPDVVPRLMTDSELARATDEAGYRAVVLKSHHTVTAARATMAQEHAAQTRIFGGAVLNPHATGGINPHAVQTALWSRCSTSSPRRGPHSPPGTSRRPRS